MSDSQLNILKSAVKNGTEVTFNLHQVWLEIPKMKLIFHRNLWLIHPQASKIRKTSANCSSANIKCSKAQLSKMIQSRGFVTDISGIISGLDKFVSFPSKVLKSYSKELCNIYTKNNLFIDAELNMIGKRIKEKFGSGITLTKNEIENVIKVLNSFENREILLKETTRKNTSQEGGFLSFLGLLMTAGLPLMKKCIYTSI